MAKINLSEYKDSIIDLKSIMNDPLELVSTGSLVFDWFLGGGYGPGFWRFGGAPEKGKTAQALTWAKNWLNKFENSKVIYFDTECRLSRAKLIPSGILNVKNAIQRIEISQHNIFEDLATRMIQALEESENDGCRLFFVIDSLDMLTSKNDVIKGFDEEDKVASVAKSMKRLLRIVGPRVRKGKHHVHYLNQLTANISIAPGSPQKKSDFGGYAPQHMVDLWGQIIDPLAPDLIWENPTATTKDERGKVIGHYFKVKLEKTPNDKSGQEIRIPIKRGSNSGVWLGREIADMLLLFSVVSKPNNRHYVFKQDALDQIKSESGIEIPVSKLDGEKNYFSWFELPENQPYLLAFEQYVKKSMPSS